MFSENSTLIFVILYLYHILFFCIYIIYQQSAFWCHILNCNYNLSCMLCVSFKVKQWQLGTLYSKRYKIAQSQKWKRIAQNKNNGIYWISGHSTIYNTSLWIIKERKRIKVFGIFLSSLLILLLYRWSQCNLINFTAIVSQPPHRRINQKMCKR